MCGMVYDGAPDVDPHGDVVEEYAGDLDAGGAVANKQPCRPPGYARGRSRSRDGY